MLIKVKILKILELLLAHNEPIFESCLIKSNKKNVATVESDNQNHVLEDSLEENFGTNDSNDLETLEKNVEEELEIKDNKENDNNNNNNNNNILEEVTMVELESERGELPEELKEFDFDFDLPLEKNNTTDELESLTLKKPNQVYFELYKNARTKAKEAKKSLVLAYLEAKNIKKTYMLDNLNDDSDSDLDAEIDDISESELEGL